LLQDGERKKLQELSLLYGSHMAQRRVIEGSLLAQVQRPSGFKSNQFGLNHHLGRYESFDFIDILNDPYENPLPDDEGNRARVEKRLGMF